MLLDRMSLSIKNEWSDDTGRGYIHYTVDEICNNLNCGQSKIMKLLAELDAGKGIGLIKRSSRAKASPPEYMSNVSPHRSLLWMHLLNRRIFCVLRRAFPEKIATNKKFFNLCENIASFCIYLLG